MNMAADAAHPHSLATICCRSRQDTGSTGILVRKSNYLSSCIYVLQGVGLSSPQADSLKSRDDLY
jgi:hypothetical protein